jgi:valyl-tRNA synthetase
VIYTIRNIRGEMKLPPSTATDVHIVGASQNDLTDLKKYSYIISALVRIDNIAFHTQEPSLDFASSSSVEGWKILIPLPRELIKQEQQRLAKEEERLKTFIDKTRTQLSNADFVSRAPEQLIEKNKAALNSAVKELADIQTKLTKM